MFVFSNIIKRLKKFFYLKSKNYNSYHYGYIAKIKKDRAIIIDNDTGHKYLFTCKNNKKYTGQITNLNQYFAGCKVKFKKSLEKSMVVDLQRNESPHLVTDGIIKNFHIAQKEPYIFNGKVVVSINNNMKSFYFDNNTLINKKEPSHFKPKINNNCIVTIDFRKEQIVEVFL